MCVIFNIMHIMCQSTKKFKFKGLIWSSIAIILLIFKIDMIFAIRRGNLIVPSSYSSVNGDLYVQLHTSPLDLLISRDNHNNNNNNINLQITYINGTKRLIIALIKILPDPLLNVTQIVVPCQNFLYGGLYELEIIENHKIYSKLDNKQKNINNNNTNDNNNNNNNNNNNANGDDVDNIDNFKNSNYISNNDDEDEEDDDDLDDDIDITVINHKHDERLKKQLDVRWPMPKLSVTPESIGTYPDEAVNVILEFPGNECDITKIPTITTKTTTTTASSTSNGETSTLSGDLKESVKITTITNLQKMIPEFWLELYFCGHDIYCDSTIQNNTKSQILYSEQIRGFPKLRFIKLQCEFFGLAGHYIVKLRPTIPILSMVSATAYIKADWNGKFVFNVRVTNILPCDPHTGIGVLFDYPACILDKDRVRLYAKQRADVASMAPPTSLHYVAEQRVLRGHHSLYFDCELFSEKYIEYCFVYVSEAISGAVANVRVDCVPTLAMAGDVAGWGSWSEWTPCSTTCAGGTKNRYRVCDSPPPRYGSKFCDGPSVETLPCNITKRNTFIGGSWECLYGLGNSGTGELPVDRPEIRAEIGQNCRCGCAIHLNSTKPRQIIAASSETCPGRTFWLIQAEDDYRIRYHIDFFRLICTTQYLKIRDGDSLNADLLAEYTGGGETKIIETIISTNSQLLIEFNSNELLTMGETCKGGFLSHAQQIVPHRPNVTVPIMLSSSSKAIVSSNELTGSHPYTTKLTLLHIIGMLFSSVIIVISALLGAQYIFRYRKYQLAENIGEPDSPAHTPRASLTDAVNQLQSRAISTSTIFSEVISLVKLRPNKTKLKHLRLRESVDGEAIENAENLCGSQKSESDGDDDEDIDDDDEISLNSIHTLTNENENKIDFKMKNIKTKNTSLSSENLSYTSSINNNKNSPPSTANSINIPPIPIVHNSNNNVCSVTNTVMPTRKCLSKKITGSNTIRRIVKNIKDNSSLRNVVDTSQDADDDDDDNNSNDNDDKIDYNNDNKNVNNPSSSKQQQQQPSTTVLSKKKNIQNDNNITNSYNYNNQTVVNTEYEDTETDSSEILKHSKNKRTSKKLSVSNSTLTNGAYSPALSTAASTARIRITNVKENKEKQNREKLLAGPGSEFSLANAEDFELDYYDYNVTNAGAVPGSYLGMDPQYLVWIPPLDDGNIINEIEHKQCNPADNSNDDDDDDEDTTCEEDNDDDEPHYEEILPHFTNINPGSNTETPTEDDPPINIVNISAITPPPPPPPPPLRSTKHQDDNRNLEYNNNNNNNTDNKYLAASTLKYNDVNHQQQILSMSNSSTLNKFKEKCTILNAIPMNELPKRNSSAKNRIKNLTTSPIRVHHSTGATRKSENIEKETAVTKSPSDLHEYYELDDIQFVDDDDNHFDNQGLIIDPDADVNTAAKTTIIESGSSSSSSNNENQLMKKQYRAIYNRNANAIH